jgi:hypothetical protein
VPVINAPARNYGPEMISVYIYRGCGPVSKAARRWRYLEPELNSAQAVTNFCALRWVELM